MNRVAQLGGAQKGGRDVAGQGGAGLGEMMFVVVLPEAGAAPYTVHLYSLRSAGAK